MTLLAKPRYAVYFALPLLLSLPLANADVLVDNLAQPLRGTSTITKDLWAAQAFVTALGPARLDSIEIPIGLAEGAPNIVAELHADAGLAQVGAYLGRFVLPAVSAGPLQTELLPVLSMVVLDPGTTYWVVLGVASTGSLGWSYIEGNASTGQGSLANFSYSTDAGVSWSNFGSDNPYYMRVNVSPVPEPSAAGLTLAGLLLIASLYRSRRASGR